MDIRDNQFKVIPESEAEPEYMIPFTLGETLTIKDYDFEVESVDVNTNRITLKPLGINKDSTLKAQLDKLIAKGGLGR